MLGKELKVIMQKVSIQIWNRLCKEVIPQKDQRESFNNMVTSPKFSFNNTTMDFKDKDKDVKLQAQQALLFVLTNIDIYTFEKYDGEATESPHNESLHKSFTNKHQGSAQALVTETERKSVPEVNSIFTRFVKV